MPAARFFFDAGSGTALWGSPRDDGREFAVDLSELLVSQALRDDLDNLVALYDTSLNWDYPPDPGPWREPQCRAFNLAVRQVIQRLRQELGRSWQIHDEFAELHEDPGLDRYLADPASFKRPSR